MVYRSTMRAHAHVVLWTLALAGAAPGCFAETPETGNGTGDTSDTGGETCPPGSPGCDCYGNGTCDDGLECTEGKCIEPSCIPGEENCTCNDGLCLGGLMCEENICRPGGSSTSGGGTATGGGTTGSDGSGPGGSDGATGGSDGSTGGMEECNVDPEDDPCTTCGKQQCCETVKACADDDVCVCMIQCIASGTAPLECGPMCGPPSGIFMELDDCRRNRCPDACTVPTSCDNLPDDASPCTRCVADACCPQLEACKQNPECECLEDCLSRGPMDPTQCLDQCGVTDTSEANSFPELEECSRGAMCTNDDGSTCYAL